MEKFFKTGSKAGIFPSHANRIGEILLALDAASEPDDMAFDGYGLHPLHGSLEGHWSVKVNGNWRITFRFRDTDAEVVNYQDYR